jgi:hypothetical protein
MGRFWTVAVVGALVAIGGLNGCDLGWDFLKEGGGTGGGGTGTAGAQTGCQSSQVVTGQFPPSGGLFSSGTFTADYSSPNFTGATPSKALGLRVSRNRLWLNDFSIEVSFFPFDDTSRDPRNGCLGRAILEINIPAEDLFCDDSSIIIQSTRISQTETSAFYAEGGDPGFTSSAVNGTIRLRSTDCESSVEVFFELAFNPGTGQRLFTNGHIDDDIDQNPAAEGR